MIRSLNPWSFFNRLKHRFLHISLFLLIQYWVGRRALLVQVCTVITAQTVLGENYRLMDGLQVAYLLNHFGQLAATDLGGVPLRKV